MNIRTGESKPLSLLTSATDTLRYFQYYAAKRGGRLKAISNELMSNLFIISFLFLSVKWHSLPPILYIYEQVRSSTYSQASMRTSEHVNCSFVLLFHHHRRHDHEKSSLACPYFIYIKTYLRRFRVVIARGNVA